ncbi:MAG: sulfurtransferase [Firmicutes bacterium]|nr:sulfurtransferase [Bacillota bacterium]
MLKRFMAAVLGLVLILGFSAGVFAAQNIKVLVNGSEISFDQPPISMNGRVLVPIRAVAESLGAEVTWIDGSTQVVIQSTSGDRYLKGLNNQTDSGTGIERNMISAEELSDLLDDDKDRDLCDYREGRGGGDSIANDPLVLDVREKQDYDAAHIPGAVWIGPAQNMAQSDNLRALDEALRGHVNQGGKNQVVVVCYTGNTSGLLCGVMGTYGYDARNLRFGYSISWDGSRAADSPINGPAEDLGGKACGG